jgi:soluble lytic murein transglycosylase-like protein
MHRLTLIIGVALLLSCTQLPQVRPMSGWFDPAVSQALLADEPIESADFALAGPRWPLLEFFSELTGDSSVAMSILRHAVANRVSPFSAFALAFIESEFDPNAINRNPGSADRGLFQLNSLSYPDLPASVVFDPEENARYGLAHFRWCLDRARDEASAVAMYNAGYLRVAQRKIPKSTREHVARFVAYKRELKQRFAALHG